MPPHAPRPTRRRVLTAALPALALGLGLGLAPPAFAGEEGEVIDLKVRQTLARLHQNVAGAKELSAQAKGVLVIPGVTKAGLLIGGAYGEGALRINDVTVGYYSMASASFGLQAGAQTYDLALFFMTTSALERFRRSDGWEVGADAEVTPWREGLTASLNTTTSRNPIIAVTFGQKGVMAGVTLEGAKYSPIRR